MPTICTESAASPSSNPGVSVKWTRPSLPKRRPSFDTVRYVHALIDDEVLKEFSYPLSR